MQLQCAALRFNIHVLGDQQREAVETRSVLWTTADSHRRTVPLCQEPAELVLFSSGLPLGTFQGRLSSPVMLLAEAILILRLVAREVIQSPETGLWGYNTKVV